VARRFREQRVRNAAIKGPTIGFALTPFQQTKRGKSAGRRRPIRSRIAVNSIYWRTSTWLPLWSRFLQQLALAGFRTRSALIRNALLVTFARIFLLHLFRSGIATGYIKSSIMSPDDFFSSLLCAIYSQNLRIFRRRGRQEIRY